MSLAVRCIKGKRLRPLALLMNGATGERPVFAKATTRQARSPSLIHAACTPGEGGGLRRHCKLRLASLLDPSQIRGRRLLIERS